MNPATAMATVLVDELVRHGVRDAVLCPGSRSAPLAFALHAADTQGRLRLHVRTDERSAAYLALGLAKGSGVPVPVVTTSGTAVANLHPAVLEASHTGVPLLLLTADRPPELRGTGANQTTAQVGIFGPAVRWQHDLGAPDERTGQVATWRSVVSRAALAAVGARGGFAGPVHLNLPLREPLVPGDGSFAEPLDGRADGAPWTSAPAVATPPDLPQWSAAAEGPGEQRTLVLVGDLPAPAGGRTDWGAAAADLAQRQGWPLVAEPSSAGAWARALPAGALLLGCQHWLERHRPDRVLVVGRVTLTRSAGRLLRDPQVVIDLVSDDGTWPDPARRVRHVLPLRALGLPDAAAADAHSAWSADWQQASAAVSEAVGPLVDDGWPSGMSVATTVLRSLRAGSLLFVGSSNAVRDVDLAGPGGPVVVANRGLAGIDGCLSTACGIALTTGRPTFALTGDLTFAHDAAALRIGPSEPQPDLTVVVVNDDGGGIFTLLEPGEPQHAAAFERVFGTPLALDLEKLCAATGTAHELITSRQQLTTALAEPPSGLRVLEVRVDRSGHRGHRSRLLDAAAQALASL